MSLRAKFVKKLIRLYLSGWSEGTLAEQRAWQEKNSRFSRLPAHVCRHPISADGVEAEWIEPDNPKQGVLFYLHGGAYALGLTNAHREFIARLALATQMRALIVCYRLAPEHPFPAALEDVITAYRWLLSQRFTPSQIAIVGDSAGGGLALAALLSLRDAGELLPAAAVCISPWTDLTLTSQSIHTKGQVDPILDYKILKQYAYFYGGQQDLTSPLISPLYADLQGLPPLLIQVGTDEILLDDARQCAEKARQAGVDVTLEVWEGMFHVFQAIPFLPETKAALRQIADYVCQRLS
jgi:acetyl esterase/lipase